ncbi:MAG TPA: VOC family protein [Gemmatimonadales bacterium]|nr:VOC family protein [Gemmatimonadales bacterium]
MSPAREPRFTLDHVELYVPDRVSAAAWYAKVLGCEPVAGTESWASNPEGPMMISPDGGRTKLALFTGEAQGSRPTAGFHRVAFRVSATEFLAFTARMAGLGLNQARVVDHGGAWSVYFSDPSGHRLEVTTYEAEPVRAARGASQADS